ncbi:MAG: hypothetical protein P8Y49_10255 [Sulfurovaceae bacterium]
MNKLIKRVKSQISAKEYVLSGSLCTQFKQCGKQSCRCNSSDKNDWHGTVTKTLNKNQAVAVKKAIREMKEINKLIERWKNLSVKDIEKL